MQLAVLILGRDDNPHIEAFRHPAEVLTVALRQLGHAAAGPMRAQTLLELDRCDLGHVIVLGAQHAPSLGVELPANAIIYNLEQAGSPWFYDQRYLALLRSRPFWDYDYDNAERLEALYGLKSCAVVRLGDTEPSTLKRFERLSRERDTDVVMVGAMSDRRHVLAARLRAQGLSVQVVSGNHPGDYGERRDELLARAKLVVNAHCYGADAPFEAARAAYLAANRVPMLFETSLGTVPWVISTCSYDDLPKLAAEFVANPNLMWGKAENTVAALRMDAPRLLAQVKLGLERAESWSPPVQRGKLALALVCTDEEKTIERAIASALPHIDSWCVSFNGKRRSTVNKIKTMLKHLPGQLHELPWRSYGENRNELLELAASVAEHALILDADEVLEAAPGTFANITEDGCEVDEVMGEMVLRKFRVVRTGMGWRYVGRVHEYLNPPAGCKVVLKPARVLNQRDGAGSKVTPVDRYLAEAEMLRQDLADDPNNSRARFYLAQSLELAGLVPEALEEYEKRGLMGGWAEEAWAAWLRIARALERMHAAAVAGNASHEAKKLEAQVQHAYLRTYESRSTRAEPLVSLAKWHRVRGEYQLALLYAQRAAALPRPPGDKLFVEEDCYKWRAADELSLALHAIGDSAGAVRMVQRIIFAVPENERERLYKNYRFFAEGAARQRPTG